MNSKPLDARTVQQITDGEFSSGRRRELLGGLDAQSPAWRQIALAFIESQIWDVEFRAVRGKRDERDSVVSPPLATARSVAFRPMLMIAALIVLSLSMGWSIGRRSPPASEAGRTGTAIVGQDATVEPHITEANTWVAHDWPYDSVVPNEVRLELLRAGYLLNETNATVPFVLPNGGIVAIPLNRIDVRYLGHVAYQ